MRELVNTVDLSVVAAPRQNQPLTVVSRSRQNGQNTSAGSALPTTRDLGGLCGYLRRSNFSAQRLTAAQELLDAAQNEVGGCDDTISGSCPA